MMIVIDRSPCLSSVCLYIYLLMVEEEAEREGIKEGMMKKEREGNDFMEILIIVSSKTRVYRVRRLLET